MITTSLITQPLTLRQRWAMIVLTDAPRPMTAVELAALAKAVSEIEPSGNSE